MIKICSPQLGISPISSLGGEIYDYQTLKGFALKGFKVLVYLPKNRNYDKSLKNLHVSYCFMTHIFPPWIYSFLCLPYLFRTYNLEKFDILRIQSPRFLGLAVIIFHFFYPKVPILSSGVTVDNARIYFPIEKYAYKLSSKIIVQSQYMKNFLIKKYDLDKSKIVVTYGGVLDGKKTWSKIPYEAKRIKKDDYVILFMGPLIERKNPLFALDVFITVRKKIPNVKFVIIGEGKLKKEMQKTVKQKGIDNDVFFIKSAYEDAKAYWFSKMDIFIFPSLNEGFGLVVTEAMSFGKVVITSKKAAFKEIIDTGKNGFTLPLNNKTWVKTCIELLKDKKFRIKIGSLARNKVENYFNWERTYDLNQKAVESILI